MHFANDQPLNLMEYYFDHEKIILLCYPIYLFQQLVNSNSIVPILLLADSPNTSFKMALPRKRYGVLPSSYWHITKCVKFPLSNDSSQTSIAFPYHHLTHKEQLEFSKKCSTKSLHGPWNEDFASLNSKRLWLYISKQILT